MVVQVQVQVQVHVTYDKEGENIQQAPAAITGLRSNLSAIHQLLLPKTTQLQNLTATLFTCVLYIIITKGMET